MIASASVSIPATRSRRATKSTLTAGLLRCVRKSTTCCQQDSIRALHLNDSKKPLGSRVDRHEHIGRGEIGLDAFRFVFQDPVFGKLPGYLETEKGTDEESGEDWDVINLRVLRELVSD